MNGEVFAEYVEKVPCPELRPGDIVVQDNVDAHKNKRAVEFIQARGARVLHLPAYSPDMNPIEMAFSKPKALPRPAGGAHRLAHMPVTVARASKETFLVFIAARLPLLRVNLIASR